MDEKPIFEVIGIDKHYKIFYDGHIDGFPEEDLIVINRFPTVLAERLAQIKDQILKVRSYNYSGQV